jgi:hypothetical protein
VGDAGPGDRMRPAQLPPVRVTPDTVRLMGGMDRLSTSMLAKPGSAIYASNYESIFGGGYQRVGGIERFDGRPSPSAASYFVSVPATTYDVAVNDTVTGQTSGATGVCIYVSAGFIVLTKVTGTFLVAENMRVGGVTKGVHASEDIELSAQLLNTLLALSAAAYRPDILQVPGNGPVRGLSQLKGTIYAWRDNGAAMRMFKATAAGWVQVDLGETVNFSNASLNLADGMVLSQGGVSATVLRVAVETGTLASGVNTGKLVITTRVGGNFAAGAATGPGVTLTLSGAQTATALLAGGRVQSDTYNFTASLNTERMYGCDGMNAEFEFDGTAYVPLNTGMATRATAIRCHKNHVFFGFRGSLQHSGIMSPYAFTVITGAAELGTGDVVTGLIPVPGSESDAAMLVLCQDSSWVLFGNSSLNWQFTPLSRQAGANAYSAEDAGTPMCHDTPGFRAYRTAQEFGNFQWQLESRLIEPLVQNKTPVAAVFSKASSRYRCFFSDGTAVSATPSSSGWEWSLLDYGRSIVLAWSGEVNGITRTFYADSDGWVYEADVGRSFDGSPIEAALILHSLSQGQPMTEKTYRYAVVETIADGPFSLTLAGEFNDSDPDTDIGEEAIASFFGAGSAWDLALWDLSFWDTSRLAKKRMAFEGAGYNVSPIFVSRSAEELPHQIKTLTVVYTPRRVSRL